MPTLEELRAIVRDFPDVTERPISKVPAWFVRGEKFAWVYAPLPSIPEHLREIIERELVIGVKVAEVREAEALRSMAPDVFLEQTTRWGEPKVAFRLSTIDEDHFTELISEAWWLQAPQFLRAQFDPAAKG